MKKSVKKFEKIENSSIKAEQLKSVKGGTEANHEMAKSTIQNIRA